MLDFRKMAVAFVAAASIGGLVPTAPAHAQANTLKVVMHSDLKILDPIWTTAYIVRNHGYLVWDTLFSMDEKFEVKPQMVDKHEISADKLTYTFTLRDGLEWHDGKPVTAADCVASIKRWGAKDSMGQKLLGATQELKVVNDKTFQLILKEPYGLVLQSLGKPSSNVPFMMPASVAATDPNTQIERAGVIGSGPFIFKADEWKPGEKVVYVKNPKYKPRSEAPSGLAGGKVVKVDRVEWIWISDVQTSMNALLAGEIDMIESPGHDLLPVLAKDKNVRLFNSNPTGNQYTFRFNVLHKPFDNPKIRQAAVVAMSQEPFLQAVIGDSKWYKVCKPMFICGTPLETNAGMENALNGDSAKAAAMLKEAGYDGTPIVLMQSTDLQVLTNLAPVAKAQLEKAGFKVDMQAMDWQTLVARRVKKEPLNSGGWSAFLTSWVAADILNPVMAGFFNAAGDKAMFGWPNDAEIEKLRDQFAKETDPSKHKAIVEAIQKRWFEYPTHVNLGQWYSPNAIRTNVEGNLAAPVTIFWNVSKK
jgi:peptide/nickel transport system substrate-binding protein